MKEDKTKDLKPNASFDGLRIDPRLTKCEVEQIMRGFVELSGMPLVKLGVWEMDKYIAK